MWRLAHYKNAVPHTEDPFELPRPLLTPFFLWSSRQETDFFTMVATLDVLLKNTTSGTLYAFVKGNLNGQLCIIQSDGRTQYFPPSPSNTVQPLAVDCAISVGPPGSTKTLQIPQLSASRIYFSVDKPLRFFLNPGPALVEPSVTNASDPNLNTVWGFAELTLNSQQLYANISYVDFVSIPIALSLTNAAGQVKSVTGISRDGLNTVCNKLQQQHQSDGAGWDQLIVKTPSGQNLRALSPNLGRVAAAWLFNGYFEPYVSQVWEKYKITPLTVDTQSSFGVVNGQVSNNALTFAGLGSFAPPSTGDIFSNSTGPFVTNTAAMAALTPRIAASLARSTLLLTDSIPEDPSFFYKNPITDHYSRILHEVNIDGRGYAFPYDDVMKSGGPDQSGAVFDPNPALLTITVGGDPGSPALDARSHIRAENYDSQSGVKTEVTTDVEAGHDVGWIANGDWIAFSSIDFGNGSLDTFHARLASGAGSGVTGQIQVRMDSLTANPIASIDMQDTGGWQNWVDKIAKLNTSVVGVHAVFLTFASAAGQDFTNVNWFTFENSATVPPPDSSPVGGTPQTPIGGAGGPYKTVGYFANWVSSTTGISQKWHPEFHTR
jgi:Beta-1,3-glucanase/Carbohydrate binding module (family 6)